nr:unnamed protein product [Spirometra erinaceieuropaei]
MIGFLSTDLGLVRLYVLSPLAINTAPNFHRNPGITLLVLAGRLYLACLASLALTRQHLSGSTSNCLFLHVRLAVENMVNASKNFPDFMDIRRLVEDVLVKNQNVNMSQTALNCLAREVFTDVGRLLKERRQKDIMTDFGCHLTDEARSEADPAITDAELRSRLRANRKRGAARLEEASWSCSLNLLRSSLIFVNSLDNCDYLVISLFEVVPYTERLCFRCSEQLRQDLQNVRRRIFSASFSCLVILLDTLTFVQRSNAKGLSSSLLDLSRVHLKFERLGAALFLPSAVTLLLFVGPLFSEYRARSYYRVHDWLRECYYTLDWRWLRTVVVAPCVEELIFRGCILFHLKRELKSCWSLCLASAGFFAVSHFHHVFEKVHAGYSWKSAIKSCSAQVLLTAFFGTYSTFIVLRTGSRFASVNRAVENMVNASKNFPDFMDIRRLVEDVLVKNQNVNMSQTALNCLAREVFTDVGRLLKERRQKDIMTDFGCHLTDEAGSEADPAITDAELRSRLRANRKRGAAKLEEASWSCSMLHTNPVFHSASSMPFGLRSNRSGHVLTKYSRLQEAYEDGLAVTGLISDSDASSETASLAPTPAPPPSCLHSPIPASGSIPAPRLAAAPLAEDMEDGEACSPLVLHSPPLEEQLSLGESAATLDTVIVIESDEEGLEGHADEMPASSDAAGSDAVATAAQATNQGSPFPLDNLQLPSAFLSEPDDDAYLGAIAPIDPTSQAEICESIGSNTASVTSLNPDVRKSEECISLDCDGGDEKEAVDSLRRPPGATVPSTLVSEISPVSDTKKGDNEPRSEISLLDSDGENETERQEAKPPSPPVSLPLHASAVDPNGATVSSTIPRGTEVISIDSDGEEEEDDDDDEPQVVHCTLPPKRAAPSNYGEHLPCQSSDCHPRRSTPNLHPSAFSLGNPQLVTQISEQRVISVSTNVFGCPVTSARIVQQRQDFVFPHPTHDSFYPPPLMMPRGFSRFSSHAWHPSPYQRFFQSNF